MKETHAWKRHVAISLVTGEEIEIFEPVDEPTPRNTIIRRILWPNAGATSYPDGMRDRATAP